MEIKADLHIHTNKSNDGVHSLPEIVMAAKACGLAAIAVADHNLSYLPANFMHTDTELLLIPACEVSTTDGHILGLFLDEPLDMAKLTAKGLPAGRKAAAEISKKGGIVVAAHPFQKAGRFQEKPDFFKYVDGIETANARAYFKNPNANQEALSYAKAHKLLQTGGSDAHSKYEVGNAYTLINPEEISLQSLKTAVKNGDCVGVIQKHTPRRRKGVSQFYKACRGRNTLKICRSMAYWGYCVMLDIIKK